MIPLRTLDTERKLTKVSKKPTQDITLELINYGLSVLEIAQKRQLTETTIYGHCTKLIQEEKLGLDQVIPEDRILEMRSFFELKDGLSLKEMMELSQDSFTWDELRLYKASTII